MGAAVDTSLVLEIEQDQTKMIWVLLGAAMFVAGGYWLVTGDFSSSRRGALAPFLGWVSMIFFGACALVGLWRLLRPVAPLTLSSSGIRFILVSPDVVPWTGVSDVSEKRVYGQKYVRLALDPAVAKALPLTLATRLVRAGRRLSDLTIGAQTLKITHDELLRLVRAYVGAHGGKTVPASLSSQSTGLTAQF